MQSLNESKFQTLDAEAMQTLNGGKWVYQWHTSDLDGNTAVMYYQDSWLGRVFGEDYKEVADHT